MTGSELDIPNIDAAVSYYFDAPTFLWALLLIGISGFFFLGTWRALKEVYQNGRQFSASLIWFLDFLLFIFGLSLLYRSFRNFQTFAVLVALLGVGAAFGWQKAKKKEEEKDKKEEKK